MKMKNIYIILLLTLFISSYSQVEYKYENEGYRISWAYTFAENDTVVKFEANNIILMPTSKLGKADIDKIKKIFHRKENLIAFLSKKGIVYDIIPIINSHAELIKHYDSLEINRISDLNKRDYICFSIIPYSYSDFVEIKKIRFNGINKEVIKNELIEICSNFKSEWGLPLTTKQHEFITYPDK